MLSERGMRFMWKGYSILYFTEQNIHQIEQQGGGTVCHDRPATSCCGWLTFTVKCGAAEMRGSLCLTMCPTEGIVRQWQMIVLAKEVTAGLLSFAAGYVVSFPSLALQSRGASSEPQLVVRSAWEAGVSNSHCYATVCSSLADSPVPVEEFEQNKLSSSHELLFIYL